MQAQPKPEPTFDGKPGLDIRK